MRYVEIGLISTERSKSTEFGIKLIGKQISNVKKLSGNLI